jgi:hypothetical protein
MLYRFNTKNLIFLIIFFFQFSFLFLLSPIYARGECVAGEYCLLAPLPLNNGNLVKDSTKITEYIPQVLRLVIALAGAMAVIMLIFAGFQYISSEGFGKKSDAKEKIQNALLGLLLVIGSYSILYTINPDLLTLNLNINPVHRGTPLESETPENLPPAPPGPTPTMDWFPDDQERYVLNRLGINIKGNPSCTTIGQSDCTSVYGIGTAVEEELAVLKESCKKNNCNITITGGTEYWLHCVPTSLPKPCIDLSTNKTRHIPGGGAVDLALDPGLLEFLKKQGPGTTATSCSTGIMYVYNNYRYVLENGDHFHVCYY